MSDVGNAGIKQNEGASTVALALKRFDARLMDRYFERFRKLNYDHCGSSLLINAVCWKPACENARVRIPLLHLKSMLN